MTMIGKTFRFEAAHQLPDHDGHCARPHGHSYKLEVILEGDVRNEPGHPKNGMVVDFGDVSKVWKAYLEPLLDHQDLNVTMPVSPTTAENIAGWILHTFREYVPQVTGVRLWETETGWASAEV